VKNRHYRAVLGLITLLAGVVAASPGCDAGDSCPGVAGKLCDKACACGGKCAYSIAGTAPIETQSKFLCVPQYTGQCGNQAGVDFAACSAALDTAECDMELQALVVPAQCVSTGGEGGHGGGAASASSSASGAGGGK
jgi:hypothetical protein